jgi:hypothetical protein
MVMRMELKCHYARESEYEQVFFTKFYMLACITSTFFKTSYKGQPKDGKTEENKLAPMKGNHVGGC